MLENEKRVFFGLEVQAPWPENLPGGRLLDPEDRHATLAFLGEVLYAPLLELIQQHFPIPPFKVGLVGKFSQPLFLPPRHPNLVAWNVEWIDDKSSLITYQHSLIDWLKQQKFYPKEHAGPWLCHVTICRKPHDLTSWKKSFKILPLAIHAIHLYESLGASKYKPLWSYPFLPPFQEIEHTADIAYIIQGESMTQLQHHAQIALAFRFPELLNYIPPSPINTLEELIINLNETIATADAAIGCPFKAISFHGNVEIRDSILQWEMIVDV